MADRPRGVDRAARADVQAVRHIDQALVEGMGELVGVDEVVVAAQGPGVGVGIEVQHGKAGMATAQGAQHRQADRAVAAQGERRRAGVEDGIERPLDGGEGAMDVGERQVDVAGIDHPARRHRMGIGILQQCGREDRGLAHGVGTQARAETRGIVAAVEGQADDGDVAPAEHGRKRQVEEGERRTEG